MTKNFLFLIIAILPLITDQIIKIKILNSSVIYYIWGDFLNISLTKNYGIFASIPFNSSEIVVVFILVLIIFSLKRSRIIPLLPYFIIALFGVMSNLIDRMRFDFVIDYINLFSFSHFNIADVLIYIGCFGVIIKLVKYNKLKIKN